MRWLETTSLVLAGAIALSGCRGEAAAQAGERPAHTESHADDDHAHAGGDHDRAHAGDGALPQRPAVADPDDWCLEHAVPESMCTRCNPALVERYRAAGDFCAGHGFPESVCPLCHPLAPPAGGLRVRLQEASLEGTVGIETAPAQEAAFAAVLEVPARIEYDPDRVAEVRAAVSGLVREVRVKLGERVEEGALLFVLESAQVGDLQAQRRATRERVTVARSNLTRQEELHRAEVASLRAVELARQELEAAQAEARAVEQALRVSGAARASGGRFEVRAPRAGVIVRRPGVMGSLAGAADVLAVVADPGSMWAVLEVPEREAVAVTPELPVELAVDGLGRTFHGRVAWVAPEVDPRTRTVSVRARFDNPDGLLRAHQYARARLGTADANGAGRRAVAVPVEALQRTEDGHVVFVRTGPGLYVPREVTPGRASGALVQVEGDLKPGDPVVTTGAFLLKTELMPGAIGAGCCEGVEEGD